MLRRFAQQAVRMITRPAEPVARIHGRDGGYAIVFNTACLRHLFDKVKEKWKSNGNLLFEDIVYLSDSPKFLEKFKQDLIEIENFSFNRFKESLIRFKGDKHYQENFYPALMKCACLHKHWGFEEKNEVRIVVMLHPTGNRKFCKFAEETNGTTFQEIPRKYYLCSNTWIPYIDLFEGITTPTSEKRLPITRIIVGPSANTEERKKRIRAVEILLNQSGIKGVEVLASGIPYIG